MNYQINEPKIQRSKIILFSLRLFFYLSVLMLLAVHPAIAISFDRIGIIQWFLIVPMQTVFAFLPYPKISLKNRLIVAGILLLLLSLIASGISITALQPFFAGVISFILTFMLFSFSQKYGARWGKLSLLEPFFLVWICLRLLAISRSSEEIAGNSAALTQFILVWSAVVFLLHGVVVYFCLFPNSKKGAGKEGVVFAAGAAAALILVLAVLPPDFIRNSIVENINNDRAPGKIPESTENGTPMDSSRRGRRRGSGADREQSLRGMSEHDWQSRSGRGRGKDGSGDNMQYLVKVVISEAEPVYMGDVFKGTLDPAEGFLPSLDEPLNELSKQRLFSTWRNREINFDIDRMRLEILSLSTLPEKYMPYRVYSVDPTIINENAGPLRYVHQVISDIHIGNPLELLFVPLRKIDAYEEQMLAQYLDIRLNNEDLQLFHGWLNKALANWQDDRLDYIKQSASEFQSGSELEPDSEFEPVNEYLEKILAILTSFSEYQYNLSYNEVTSISSIKEFLFETKDGDCTEFSNSLALLGRLAGIPSRVVTGYLASEELQTEAHLKGLVHLQRQIPFLQQFKFDALFMVTNMHAHSWTQFYIPDYGWLDFESTSFAIPPLPSSDANNFDVVIPIIEKGTVVTNLKKFPWRAVLRAAVLLAAAAICSAYALRYGREAVLYTKSRSGSRDGARTSARALYLLLLAKLAADGKPIKPASKTATEYGELFGNNLSRSSQRTEDAENFNVQQEYFKNFASLYSELRWREFENKNEIEEKFELLKQEYKQILKISKRRGPGWFFVRIISLRGLAYL